MGLFDALFKHRPKKNLAPTSAYNTLTAYQPVFRTYNGQIYENELVRAAIDARARNISKLGIVIKGEANPKLRRKLELAPNEFMTWSQFLYRVSTILDMQNTCFIVPIFDEFGVISGFYPILPDACELVEYKEQLWLRYRFRNGQVAAIEFESCGVLTKFQYKDDFFGEPNRALNATMQLININNQAIEEGAKSAATYRFMARINNFIKDEDLVKERKRFSEKNFKGEGSGGLLLFPNTYSDIKQIESHPFTIDAKQVEQIRENVFNYFAVNDKIIKNAATDDEIDAFYNGCIEPFAIQLSEILTKIVYTVRERAVGNKIQFVSNKLQYMSVPHKVQMAQTLADRGMMTIDEIRELFSYPPLPDGKGSFVPVRGEYYNVMDEDTGNNDIAKTNEEEPTEKQPEETTTEEKE